MFWATDYMVTDKVAYPRPGIWMSGMDGLNATRIVPDVRAALLTIDHYSQLLFWVQENTKSYDICYSSVDGTGVKRAMGFHNRPHRLRIAGNRLFWLDKETYSRSVVLSGSKYEAGGAVMHNLEDARDDVVDFLVVEPIANSGIQAGSNDYCIPDALCSHMCIPSTTGYMQCFCPYHYELGSDGWTCGEQ